MFLYIGLTHPELDRAGPSPAEARYSLKYWGIDTPRKRESPTIYIFLIELLFKNCENDIPTAATKIE